MLLTALSLLCALASTALALPAVHILRDTAIHQTYDYIVIGGGTSGLVIGNRLSENSATTVLVLEAGPLLASQAEEEILVPGLLRQSFGRKYWWPNITSLPNAQLNNTTTQVGAGRVVGGGTVVNGMFFDRGSRRDYDEWAEYIGDKSWGWEGLLRYFKKAETFTPPGNELREEWGVDWDPTAHGTSGPVHASYPPYIFPDLKYYIAALKALGVPMPKDGANGNAVGAFWIPNSLDPVSQTRSYSKTAYHDKAESRRANYHLATERTATKIIFNRKKRAVAVEFSLGPGAPVLKVNVRKEVILAAGAVLSPGLLQLSGIGDAALLKKLKIPVVVDLPGVGNNYQDHASSGVYYQSRPDPVALGISNNQSEIYQRELARYYKDRTGPFTASAGSHATFLPLPFISPRYRTLLSSASSRDPASHLRPSLPPTVLAGYKHQRAILLHSLSTNLTAAQESVQFGGRYSSSIQKPLSRGYVEITSTDAFAPPALDYRTLSDPFDLEMVVDAVRFARRIIARPEMAPLQVVETAPRGEVAADEERMRAWVKANISPSNWHSAGTTAMGRREEGGVVDRKLRVYGVVGLRVVDAGIMPIIPATHLSRTVYAVAEKAADLIKAGL